MARSSVSSGAYGETHNQYITWWLLPRTPLKAYGHAFDHGHGHPYRHVHGHAVHVSVETRTRVCVDIGQVAPSGSARALGIRRRNVPRC